MTHQGNMNPLMSQVDIVPDEDLNTRLKFYVSKKYIGKIVYLWIVFLTYKWALSEWSYMGG
jgi:hypothetical protein